MTLVIGVSIARHEKVGEHLTSYASSLGPWPHGRCEKTPRVTGMRCMLGYTKYRYRTVLYGTGSAIYNVHAITLHHLLPLQPLQPLK